MGISTVSDVLAWAISITSSFRVIAPGRFLVVA